MRGNQAQYLSVIWLCNLPGCELLWFACPGFGFHSPQYVKMNCILHHTWWWMQVNVWFLCQKPKWLFWPLNPEFCNANVCIHRVTFDMRRSYFWFVKVSFGKVPPKCGRSVKELVWNLPQIIFSYSANGNRESGWNQLLESVYFNK